ncbi:MAG: MFS transporter [Desulfotignum sp.]|nr:MFS transporter [Desulfotignum sp.]
MTPAPNQTNSKFPYLAVVFLTAIFFLNFIIRIIISPLMPTILEDMGLTPDQAGSFFLVSASGYCVALLCSGFVSSRFLHVKTIVFSAIATGLMMVITGLSHNLTLMRWAVFAAGMAAGLYLPSGIAILTTTVTEKNWGKAMGIHELAPNMSFLLAPVLCEALLLWMTWRQVLFCVGAASILMGLSFLRFFRIRDFAGKSPNFNALAPLAATPSFWCMMLLFSLGVSGTLGIYAMLPLFLVNAHGMAQAQANTLITLSRVATLPMPLVIGWISDRFGLKPVLATVLAVNGLLVFGIGVSNGFLLQVWVFCQPVVAVCFFPPAFAALSRIGSEKMRSVAVSFTIPAAFLAGGGLVPSLIGFLGDRGWFAAGFMAAGGLVLAGAAVPFFLTFHRPEN